MALNYRSFDNEHFKILDITRAALIKCMHELGVSSIEVGETTLRDLADRKVSLEYSQAVHIFAWTVKCPELAEAQKQKKKQLPWDENKNEEIEITIEET